MSDTILAAIIGGVVGAAVAGLFSLLITIPQVRLSKEALNAQFGQVQVPFLVPALKAAGPLFLRRYATHPPDKDTLHELADRWHVASESLVLAMPQGLGRRIDDLVSEYIRMLFRASDGEVTSQELEKARTATIGQVNDIIESAVHNRRAKRSGHLGWLLLRD